MKRRASTQSQIQKLEPHSEFTFEVITPENAQPNQIIHQNRVESVVEIDTPEVEKQQETCVIL